MAYPEIAFEDADKDELRVVEIGGNTVFAITSDGVTREVVLLPNQVAALVAWIKGK